MYKRVHEVPPAPKTLVADTPDWLNSIIMKCLERDPANRYQSAAEITADIEAQQRPSPSVGTASPMPAAQGIQQVKRTRYAWIAAGATAVLSLAFGAWWFYPRPALALTERDTIVLSDFTNKTGDAVFDDALKQALAADLGQSPFLNIVSDQKVRAALQQMTRSPGDRITEDIAREVCQRAGCKALISGSIAGIGSQYVIGLAAINCASGDQLAVEQIQVTGKDNVLNALGKAAAKLRGGLGESLRSVQKFDVPLEQATTSSLEALKAFSLGRKQNSSEAVHYYERAIELDPAFATAHLRLGIALSNLGQIERGRECIAKAFSLRENRSEREKLYIASSHYTFGTGEPEKAVQTLTIWAQSYPRDWLPYHNLGVAYSDMGRYEKAAEAARESLRLYPDNVTAYENLGMFYLALDRFPEAQAATDQALARKLDEEVLHTNLFSLAFLRGDSAGMAKAAAWFDGKPNVEHNILGLQSATEAYFGRINKSRELARRAIASADSAQNKESAAAWAADAALREALFGNQGAAREWAGKSLKIAQQGTAVLALAVAGDAAAAQAMTEEMNKRLPLHTVTQSIWLPAIRGRLAINRKSPSSAIEILQAAVPYELGGGNGSCIYPAYIRGEAYLAIGQGSAAAAEFQKILDHRGLTRHCPTVPLAHLGLAHAYALQKDTAKARAAYQDFLTLWKDADSDIPVLKLAKAEFAALQ